jgi:hypothetical protein
MQFKPIHKCLLWIGGVIVLLFVICALVLLASTKQPGPLATARLADGRILRIEGVTLGTEHRIGKPSFVLEHFGPWLPQKLRQYLEPKLPENKFTLDSPGLVVWVNALDPNTGKAVDCQSIRVEFVDANGDLFPQYSSSWFGGPSFWRAGHIFRAWPREAREFTFQVTSMRSNGTVRMQFRNPNVATAAHWTGGPLPQQKAIGNLEIALTHLTLRTNGGPRQRWETPAPYWEPEWELHREGKPAEGWSEPEWSAEDPTGNRGHILGVHQPVLRFSATFYPVATNTEAALPVATLPKIVLTNVSTNIVFWNLKTNVESKSIEALGFFPKGMYTFCEGMFVSNPPVSMSPTRGGAPSGWVGMNQRISPVQVKEWSGHYTPDPVIYVRAPSIGTTNRLAIRLRDDHGEVWIAKPEPEGASEDIMPFTVKLPDGVQTVVPEIVLLKPVTAEFMARTDTAADPLPR